MRPHIAKIVLCVCVFFPKRGPQLTQLSDSHISSVLGIGVSVWMTLRIMFSLSVVVEGHGHSLRLMAQDAVEAGAWLAVGMWPQGPPD